MFAGSPEPQIFALFLNLFITEVGKKVIRPLLHIKTDNFGR